MASRSLSTSARASQRLVISLYPFEQAAFEQYFTACLEIAEVLKTVPPWTMTTPICRHGYWLAGDTLFFSHDAGIGDVPLSRNTAVEALTLDSIGDIGATEFMEFTDAALKWLEEPSFIVLPKGTYMGDPLPQVYGGHGKTASDPRKGRDYPHPQRPFAHDPTTVTVRKSTAQGADMLLLDGKETYMGETMVALLAGSSLITAIRLLVPNLQRLGRPSCFEVLTQGELVTHLAHGSSYSPLNGRRKASATVADSPDTNFYVEYSFVVSQCIRDDLRSLVASRY